LNDLAVIPSDIQAERYILSMCLSGGPAAADVVPVKLTVEHFFAARHRAIYSAILNLWSKGVAVTWHAVAKEVGEDVFDEDAVPTSLYVQSLNGIVPFEATQAEFHCQEIDDKFRLRQLLRIIQAANDRIALGVASEQQIVHDLTEQLILTNSGTAQLGQPVSEVIDAGLREETLARMADPDRISGVRTGVWSIDRVLGGLENGRVYTGLAQTSIGKSYWVHWLALQIAKMGKRSIIFSTEMPNREVTKRMAFMEAGFDELPIKTGRVVATDSHMEAINNAFDFIHGLPIVTVPAGGMDVEALGMETRRHKKLGGVDMVFIDHIQGLKAKGLGQGQERELIRTITAYTKALALNLDLPIMQISHTSRSGETEMTRPSLSDGYGSGSIEQDSDAVFSIHPQIYSEESKSLTNFPNRESYNKYKSKYGKVAMEILWQKSRSGGSPTGLFYLDFNVGGRWVKIEERG